jgi:hypothetical protein
MFALKFVMKTTPTTYAIVVPIPTLPPETEIGELVTVAAPLNTGTVPEEVVPEVVTAVCAAALIAYTTMQIATAAILLCIVLPDPFVVNLRLRKLVCVLRRARSKTVLHRCRCVARKLHTERVTEVYTMELSHPPPPSCQHKHVKIWPGIILCK